MAGQPARRNLQFFPGPADVFDGVEGFRMSRAHRIKQIAEANQRVFSSAATAEWWLTERNARPLPAESTAKIRPSASRPDAAPVAQPAALAAAGPDPRSSQAEPRLQLVPAQQTLEAPRLEQHFPIERVLPPSEVAGGGSAQAGRAFDADGVSNDLTWDAKTGCFVASR